MINQKFDYLYAENGRLKAVVVDNNGEPQVTDVTPDKPYSQSLITDGQGDTLVVSKKGQVMGVKEYKFAGDDRHLLNEYHRQLDSLGDWQINFNSAKEKQTYAFDQIGSGNHGIFATDEYYPKSGSYDFRYKSVECGKSDRVKVDFGSYPQADSVVFKDKYGVTLKLTQDNLLTFTGVSKADTNYIYAYRGDKKIGKLFLNTYKPQTKYIELVSVNRAKIDKSITAEGLNKIFKGAVVNFKIETKSLDIQGLQTFTHGGSNWHSVYNDDQKKVLEAYDKEMKDGVYYLFFIDDVRDKKDSLGTSVSGYMPRGYNAGFIYDRGSLHTVAHELGHGIGNLEHAFSNSSNSGKTKNLMDYSTGEELWHFQWDQIQDPARKIFKWWQNEEGAESLSKEYVESDNQDGDIFTFKDTKQLTFLSPGRMPITLPPNYTSFSFVSSYKYCPDGVLTKFKTEDGNYYGHYSISKDKTTVTFLGYVKILNPNALIAEEKYAFEDEAKTKKVYYKDIYSKELKPDQNILFGFKESSQIDLYQLTYSNLDLTDAQQNMIRQSDYTAKGLCTLDGFDYEFTDFGWHPFDNEVWFKTSYAYDFYDQVVKTHKLSEMSIDEKNILWRIAKILDNLLSESNLSDDEFNKFTKVVTLDYLCDNTLWTLDDYKYFEKKLDIFFNELTGEKQEILEDFIKTGNLQSTKNTEEKITNTNITTFTPTYKYFFYQYYLQKYGRLLAEYQTLLHIIKSVSSTMMGSLQETIVLEAIDCIRESDFDKFIDDLNSDGLMKDLCYHIDGDNYAKFVFSVYDVYCKSNKLNLNLDEDKYLVNGSHFYFWESNVKLDCRYTDNNQIEIIRQTDRNFYLDQTPYAIVYHLQDMYYDTKSNIINPFDFVVVKLNSVPEVLEDKYNENDVMVVPAFVLHLFCNMNKNIHYIEYISDVFTVISVATTFGTTSYAINCGGAAIKLGVTKLSKNLLTRFSTMHIKNNAIKSSENVLLNSLTTNYTSKLSKEQLVELVISDIEKKYQKKIINVEMRKLIEKSCAEKIASENLKNISYEMFVKKSLKEPILRIFNEITTLYAALLVIDGFAEINAEILKKVPVVTDAGYPYISYVAFKNKIDLFSVLNSIWNVSSLIYSYADEQKTKITKQFEEINKSIGELNKEIEKCTKQ